MTWWLPHNFSEKRAYLAVRSQCLQALRGWFFAQNFDEVHTPALQVTPVMDPHIHGFKTQLVEPDLQTAHEMYLHTSPEFAMKKLLVAGMARIYQLCPVYRNGDMSRLHSPEFMLLEWYRTQSDYHAMMQDCEDLVRAMAQEIGKMDVVHKDLRCDLSQPFERISVAQAFERYANIDLHAYLHDRDGFAACIMDQGIRVADDDAWDDIFFHVMAERIEQHLGKGRGCILYDYPAAMASLSRKKPEDPRYAERFELYLCGVEIANAFSELTDAAEQRARFEADMADKKRLYGAAYPLDEDFLQALDHGMPESSGCALGFDRLVMLLAGADNLDQVLWCPVDVPR